jgi:hypothetical protein
MSKIMATFPTLLKTGAIAQYPLNRVLSLATQAVRFLDGSRQTYQLSGAGLRRWELKLDLLDETEVSAVIAFAEQIGTGTFSFTNPVTGEIAAKCVIADEQLETSLVDELHGRATLEIQEVK